MTGRDNSASVLLNCALCTLLVESTYGRLGRTFSSKENPTALDSWGSIVGLAVEMACVSNYTSINAEDSPSAIELHDQIGEVPFRCGNSPSC